MAAGWASCSIGLYLSACQLSVLQVKGKGLSQDLTSFPCLGVRESTSCLPIAHSRAIAGMSRAHKRPVAALRTQPVGRPSLNCRLNTVPCTTY